MAQILHINLVQLKNKYKKVKLVNKLALYITYATLPIVSILVQQSSTFAQQVPLYAQQNNDVFLPISKYIQQGDSQKLSAWFANNLELDILGNINDCSKIQATQIMKDFFVKYQPKVFSIIHKSGKAPMKYAVGNLSAGGETFRVTLFVKTCTKDGNQIQQLIIERE